MTSRTSITVHHPASAGDSRPALVLVAVDMGRHLGTEPGKAWAWACAIARRYRLHVVTAPAVAARCRHEKDAAEWSWHITRLSQPTSMGFTYYRDYARWCREVPRVVRALVPEVQPVGLHHITLGSFRILPRYDQCGIPYTLGPLGGGESTPRAYLGTARLQWGPWISELMRPWLNNAFAAIPSLRAVMGRSRLALATSSDTEAILRRMGAKTTGVVFPDRVPADVDPARAQPPAERAADLKRCVRLVWSGRAVWWKAGQLAVELLRRLVQSGVNAELTVFSYGHALAAWRRQIRAAGVSAYCRIGGFVPRGELLVALGRAHVFVYPTLHDSSSPALLEAYAMGLPSLSVGLGGPAVVATKNTGYNVRPANLDEWLDGAVARVRQWQQDPVAWATASMAARARAGEFGSAYLGAAVDQWLAPELFSR